MSTLPDMGAAVAMAAMMVPSAAPFFISYGRDTRRPAAVATVVLIYAAAWATIGLALDTLMDQVMLPSSWQIAAAAVGVALLYAITPWGRWARSQCQELCERQARGRAARAALRYTACCAVCSAGVMAAVMVIGMSNPIVVALGAAAMFLYKFSGGPALRPARRT